MRARKLWAGYRFRKPRKIPHSDSRGRPGGLPGRGEHSAALPAGYAEHGAARPEEGTEESTGLAESGKIRF